MGLLQRGGNLRAIELKKGKLEAGMWLHIRLGGRLGSGADYGGVCGTIKIR